MKRTTFIKLIMTAKTAFNLQFHSGKPSVYSGDAEVTPDLHFRMSKKIAQLTKVIYSLKTKTDDSDSIIESMKIDHQNQIQKIIQDNQEHLQTYQTKINSESLLKQQIEILEANLIEFEDNKKTALAEFHEYRQRAEKRESSLKSEHNERLLNFSHEMLTLKRDFESQILSFQLCLADAKTDKANAIKEMERKHRFEIEKMNEAYISKTCDVDTKIAALNELHMSDKEKWKELFETQKTDHEKVIEDYEIKLNKARAFYENELLAFKTAYESSSLSEIDKLNKHNELLRKDFENEKKQLNDKIESLLSQIIMTDEDKGEFESEIKVLRLNITGHENTIAGLQKKLEDLQKVYEDIVQKFEAKTKDLTKVKELNNQQKDQLSDKAKLIVRLEVKDKEQTTKINTLTKELADLKSQFSVIELENQKLFGSNKDVHEKTSSQLEDLKKALDDMTIRKRQVEERLKKELADLDKSSLNKQTEMHNEFTSTIITLEKQYAAQVESLKKTSADDLKLLKQDKDTEIDQIKSRHNKAYAKLEERLSVTTTDLQVKIESAENEVDRLKATLQSRESGLGTASSQLSSLTQHNEELTKKLKETTDLLDSHKAKILSLTNEVERLKNLRESDRKKSELLLKSKIRQLTEELDSKWSQQLNEDTARLQEHLSALKDTEKERALCEIRTLKECELNEVKDASDKRINELLQQIASDGLRKQQEIESLKKQWIDKGMSETATEFGHKMAAMESQYQEKIDFLNADYATQLQELERRLKSQHLQELQTQMLAHKAVIQGARADVERQWKEDVAHLKTTHHSHLNETRQTILDQHNSEIDKINYDNNSQVTAVKMELRRALEVAKEKEKDNATKIEELHEEIVKREQHIQSFVMNMESVRKENENLSKELDSRTQQIQAIQANADTLLQRRLEQNEDAKTQEMSKIREDHVHDIQRIMADFSTAQNMLKSRISELNILLEASELRLSQRDSRPEDIELIDQLRDKMLEKEAVIKHLKEEKKYYELELVNRETNFNKIFTSSQAKVSILHAAPPPMKRVADKALTLISPSSSTTSVSSKLEPLPGSPFHDEKFTRVKPLPPSIKRVK